MTVTYRSWEERRLGFDIVEPKPWPCDEGARREPVIDRNLDRVVRRVGWRRCMCCSKWMFSPDVSRVRLHDQCRELSVEP